MKISKYTKLLCNDGSYFIYNSLSNYFCHINEDLYNFLENVQNNNSLILRKEIDLESEKILLTKNIITENDDDDILKYISIIKRRRNVINPLLLTIAPTLECNFSCPYCFETKEKGKMDESTIDNIIRFVKHQKYLESISITWFGGEPLLYPDIIETITERLETVCRLPVRGKIITNGYFLDKKNIELLERCKVNEIQLTIDGLNETHNKIKFTSNDVDTFGTIINNIDTFSKHNTFANLIIRVNIDKNNLNEFGALFTLLTDKYRNYKNIFIAPSFIIQNTKNACKDSCIISNIEKFSIIKGFSTIMKNLNLIYPSNNITECSARNPSTLVIAPNGDLYKCWEIIGNRNYKIGQLTKDGLNITDNTQLNRYLYGADPFEDEPCKQCFYLPICGGGCPHKRIENKFNYKNYDLCIHFEKNMEDFLLLRTTYENNI
ncbi:MAG: SPASM domain-containing protein [Marinilabiliaceae bacterium]|nr:SPASM domain-containing protein [Marinilabiliaceae bacterium]